MNIYEDEDSEQAVEITLEELEAHRITCRELIEGAKSAVKLAENPDFKKLIMEQYFDQEPKRLGSIMASGKLTPNAFDDAVADLKAIGNLSTFLQEIVQKGRYAEESLASAEEAYNEAMAAQEAS